MLSVLKSFAKIAPALTNLYVLVGFVVLLFVWVIAKPIVEKAFKNPLTKEQNYKLLTRIVNWVFLLIGVFIALAFSAKLLETNHKPKYFTSTIFIQDSIGKAPLESVGKLTLYIRDDPRPSMLDENGSATFKEIPSDLMDSSTKVRLDANGWEFSNRKEDTSVTLSEGGQHLTVRRDNSCCCIYGRVKYEGKLIQKCEIIIDDTSLFTNKNGYFYYILSPQNFKPKYRVLAKKDGYQLWDHIVSLPLREEVGIALESKTP